MKQTYLENYQSEWFHFHILSETLLHEMIGILVHGQYQAVSIRVFFSVLVPFQMLYIKAFLCGRILKEIFTSNWFAEICTNNASYPRSHDCSSKYTNYLGLQPSLGSLFTVYLQHLQFDGRMWNSVWNNGVYQLFVVFFTGFSVLLVWHPWLDWLVLGCFNEDFLRQVLYVLMCTLDMP